MKNTIEQSKVAMELVKELREIWNDNDFVSGIITFAENEYGWYQILSYIRNRKRFEQEISVEDICYMSLEVALLPDDLVDVDIQNEEEFAERYAYTNSKVGHFMHDSDDEDYPCPTKYLKIWLRYESKLATRIIKKLEQEGWNFSGIQGTHYKVLPFMERNGYMDASGWWVKKEEI